MTVHDTPLGAAFVASALASLPARLRPQLTNWSRTTSSTPPALFLPRSVDEVKAILNQASENNVRIRILGSRYCMNGLWTVDDGSYALSLEKMKDFEFTIDSESGIATIPGQLTIGEINERLVKHNLTLPSMGSVSGPTIAGCVSTCTHGTGVTHSTISSYVTALTIVVPPTPTHPTARVLHVGRHSPAGPERDLFLASLCGLGCTGVIVSVAIRCPPLRLMTERTGPYAARVSDALFADLEPLARSAERVRLWWNPATGALVKSAAHSIDDPAHGLQGTVAPWWRTRLVGCYAHQALLFLCSLHPLLWRLHPFALALLTRFSHHGITHVRTGLPGKVQEMDCLYAQRTTEYSVRGFARAQAVLRELRVWIEGDERPREMNGMVEIRFACADDIPLSPAFGEEGEVFVDIGLVQYVPFVRTRTTRRLPYEPMAREFERILLKHGGRVHWAKECRKEPGGIKAVEEMWGPGNQVGTWARVVKDVDPKGIFWNQWLEDRLGGVH